MNALAGMLWIALAASSLLQSPSLKSVELFAAADLAEKQVRAEGTLWLPAGIVHVNELIVLVSSGGAGGDAGVNLVYEDPRWRKLSEDLHCGLLALKVSGPNGPDLPVAAQIVRNADAGGGQALFLLLGRLADGSGHRELKDARLLLWGVSAAGSFATTFAALEPERTIGFIRYHSNSRGLPVDIRKVERIPALLLAGAADETAGVEDARDLWQSGRAAGAPWTFAIEPREPHGSDEGLRKAGALMIPWVSAVFHQRVSPDGIGLRAISESSGWVGNNETLDVAPYASFPMAAKSQASWLPDEASGRAWQTVSGVK